MGKGQPGTKNPAEWWCALNGETWPASWPAVLLPPEPLRTRLDLMHAAWRLVNAVAYTEGIALWIERRAAGLDPVTGAPRVEGEGPNA